MAGLRRPFRQAMLSAANLTAIKSAHRTAVGAIRQLTAPQVSHWRCVQMTYYSHSHLSRHLCSHTIVTAHHFPHSRLQMNCSTSTAQLGNIMHLTTYDAPDDACTINK